MFNNFFLFFFIFRAVLVAPFVRSLLLLYRFVYILCHNKHWIAQAKMLVKLSLYEKIWINVNKFGFCFLDIFANIFYFRFFFVAVVGVLLFCSQPLLPLQWFVWTTNTHYFQTTLIESASGNKIVALFKKQTTKNNNNNYNSNEKKYEPSDCLLPERQKLFSFRFMIIVIRCYRFHFAFSFFFFIITFRICHHKYIWKIWRSEWGRKKRFKHRSQKERHSLNIED